MLSLLRSNGTQLVHTFYVDGTATNADTPVTVGITKADGTALVPAGTATTNSGTGAYAYVLAPQAALNLLTVTWTGTFSGVVQSQTDQIEIVGGFYVTLAEIRTVPGLSEASKVSNDVLAAKRRSFERLVERYCGLAFVPRFARETIKGNGTTSLLLGWPFPRTLLSAKTTDTGGTVTTFTVTNWGFQESGYLITDGDTLNATIYGERNITVEYEHGLDAPDTDLVEAGKDWIAYQVLKDRSQTGRNYSQRTGPDGFTETPIIPDWNAGRPTGLIDVDNVLNGIGRAAPRVA